MLPSKSKILFHRVTRGRNYLSGEAKLEKTALYDFHLKTGGKMVPFAGYELPVQVKTLTLWGPVTSITLLSYCILLCSSTALVY